MSVAPHSGIIDFGTFTPPATPLDGIQGEVPAPLVGQEGYVLSASGWVPGGSISGLGTMSTQNANNVAITGGSINGTAIGASTASSGAFTTLIGGGGSANYAQITGGATTKAVQFQTLGTDTNISQVFQSKGTGAIDLAAGSSGVNISNGGTVTAITRTATGSGYTSNPTMAISAPTTAGGVQATATCSVGIGAVSVAGGGTGYTVGDTLTIQGGIFNSGGQATLSVTAVSGGVVTAVSPINFGAYTTTPTNPISVTGGTGTGATVNVSAWAVSGGTNAFTITNAGSGYVEQPTVTFSGGGGSGAAAYATVGSIPTVKSIGAGMSFYTPGGEQFRVSDTAGVNAYVAVTGQSNASPGIFAGGTPANIGLNFSSKASGGIGFLTNGFAQTQLFVTHTASAVNYVQVTGAATGSNPTISVQGSDSSRGLAYTTKGAANHNFFANNLGYTTFVINGNNASSVNYLQVASSATTAAPVLSSQGTDTDIDLSLTPKGAGLVRFGTYTAGIITATGYINIKAADGTTYKLLVST